MLKRPLSKHYPILKKPIRKLKIFIKNIQYLDQKYNLEQSVELQDKLFKVKKHKSLLRRKLGNSQSELQEQKIVNLEIAAKHFNGLIIKPNQIFSFWKNLGEPKYSKGFVDGMILDSGKVIVGLGGGLCQMANLLYWLFLHSPMSVKEHHHHILDIFPDSGRVLPFGSGAGVLYNYGDLQFENKTQYAFYLKVWQDEEFLHGEVYTVGKEFDLSYKIIERDHAFYTHQTGKVFRQNKIFRVSRVKIGGKFVSEEVLTVNDSEVLYQISPEEMTQKNQFYHDKQIESDRLAKQYN